MVGLERGLRTCRETDTIVPGERAFLWLDSPFRSGRPAGVLLAGGIWQAGDSSGVSGEEVAGCEHGCPVMACAVGELAVRGDDHDLRRVRRSFDPA